MKRFLFVTLAMIGFLPFACNSSCDESRAYTVELKTVDMAYSGNLLSNPSAGKDTFRFDANAQFQIHVTLTGEMNFAEAKRPFWDGGTAWATDPCPPDYSKGFKPGIDSFVLRANRNIGLVPAGESLNTVFLCNYHNSYSTSLPLISLKALNDSIQKGSINLTNFQGTNSYKLILQPQNMGMFGSHVFTLEIYRKNQNVLAKSSAVVIFE
ncbi:MAG: hypothetical protein EP332_10235 [Bacteroidetes bacterium]|nr:MAG: hypothetical protein EP332_10235 [Bacteroidota bacterium]